MEEDRTLLYWTNSQGMHFRLLYNRVMSWSSESVCPEFLLVDVKVQSSRAVFRKRDEIQDQYLEVSGAYMFSLGKVWSNSVSLELVCVSVCSGRRPLSRFLGALFILL